MTGPILANRIREVILSGKWIANTNLKELLSDVGLGMAMKKTGQHNSIAALTFHIHYYLSGVMRVLEGGPLDIRDQYSFDMPQMNSEADWKNLQETLWSDAERFANVVEKLSREQLVADFANPKYGSVYRNIEAIIEHSYYHMGQISLIKRLITQQTA